MDGAICGLDRVVLKGRGYYSLLELKWVLKLSTLLTFI